MIHEGAALCVLCDFHKQECTFVQSPLPRKRKVVDGDKKDSPSNTKKRYVQAPLLPLPQAKSPHGSLAESSNWSRSPYVRHWAIHQSVTCSRATVPFLFLFVLHVARMLPLQHHEYHDVSFLCCV